MIVFPAVNCDDRKCLLDKLSLLKDFLPKKEWVHIDVSDMTFAYKTSFFDAALIEKYAKYFNFECHLMMDWKMILNGGWFESKCKRFLVHNGQVSDWDFLRKISKKHGKEIGVVVDFDDNTKSLNFPKWIKFVEVLAVKPGISGQKFQKKAIKVIYFLKKSFPNVRIRISVDGGVDLQVGKLAKKNGADILISSSYIWESKSPKEAFKKLSSV